MPDDERPRRRLGDETKNRIADLASGWSLDGEASEPPGPAVPAHTPKPAPASLATPKPAALPPPPRAKQRTNPPPPPGSPERKALEDKIVAAAPSRAAPIATDSDVSDRIPVEVRRNRSGSVTSEHSSSASGRISSTSMNPVAGETRDTSSSGARSGPQYRRAGYAGPQAPFATERRAPSEPRTPPVIVDESISGPIAVSPSPVPAAPAPRAPAAAARAVLPLPAPNASSVPGLAVPVGEFDSGVQTIEQSTMRRDDADALADIPEYTTPFEELVEDDEDEAPGEERGDATMIDPRSHGLDRGDPTQAAVPDATELQGAGMRLLSQSGGTLRPSAALRRKRGLAGDVRYVFTVLFGVRASRRELAELQHRQDLRQTSRRRHLITLGRAAVATDAFDHPALAKARQQLQAIEEERAKHVAAVVASDGELERLRRERDAKVQKYVADLSATDAELAELAKKLEPLEKEAAIARKRAQELRESLQRIEKKIADTEAKLTSVKAEKLDKAALQADIATFKADRNSVLRDEPVLAAELDALNPRIAAMEATRAELRKKRADLEKAEVEDQRRTSELLEAIGAKRKVVERAAADAEAARDNALFELGDRLYVDRPKILAAQLSPIDQIDLEVGEADRRMMELREIISNVDKAKFARGMAMIILALAVAGSFVTWLLYVLL